MQAQRSATCALSSDCGHKSFPAIQGLKRGNENPRALFQVNRCNIWCIECRSQTKSKWSCVVVWPHISWLDTANGENLLVCWQDSPKCPNCGKPPKVCREQLECIRTRPNGGKGFSRRDDARN